MILNYQNEEKDKFNSKITVPTPIKNNSENISYISFAKIISSYGVIVLHINGFWRNHSKNIKLFLLLNFYESFFYYSVPVFVLCIGATLLHFNEKYGLLEYNKRRVVKVIIPLLGWNIILYFYKAYYLKNLQIENLSFSNIWNYFFLSKVYHIFDSLHKFIQTYMLIPLIAYIEISYKLKICIYYFFFLLITQALIPYLINLFHAKLVWIYTFKMGYIMYILAGYIIQNYKFSIFQKYIIYILGIFSFIIHFFGTFFSFLSGNQNLRLHKGYLNFPSILYSCAIFLFIKEKSFIIFGKKYIKIINKLGSLTFGPFFLHNPLIETISSHQKLYKFLSFNTLYFSFFIFLLCLIITKIIKNIPILKILVP